MKKHSTQPEMQTKGWYFTRMMFARGRPGTLMLHDGQLAFVTGSATGGVYWVYENVSGPDELIFKVDLAEVISVSYGWLSGSLTLRTPDRRHIVGFTGPPSGSTTRDTGSLISALSILKSWHSTLEPLYASRLPSQSDIAGSAGSSR